MALPDPVPDRPSLRPAADPVVKAVLTGTATATRTFKVLCVVLVVPCVVVPVVLVALAVTQPSSGPDADTSRLAQLIWSGCLVAAGLFVLWSAGRSKTTVDAAGITRRWGWRTVTVPWAYVSGYAASAGRRPGVWVLRAGEAPLRVPTPWHHLSFDEARAEADQVNRACGIVPPPTWGAAIQHTDGPLPRPLEGDGFADPELRRILSGNVLRSGWGIACTLGLATLGLLLPGILIAMAAAPGTGDGSRPDQVTWAVILFVSYLILVGLAGLTGVKVTDTGITARYCGKVRRVRWNQVQAFLPFGAGVVVLTRSGALVKAAVRLGSKAGKEQSSRETAYLNGTFGLGVPLRQCDNCQEQFFEARQGLCRFHPGPPVSLGTRGEGDQRRSWWMYECCWLVALSPVGQDGRELSPPVSGGCRVGAHVAPDWVVANRPEVTSVQSSLDSWLRPRAKDDSEHQQA